MWLAGVCDVAELGIDPSEIWKKARAFLIPQRPIPPQLLQDADLAGPLFFSTLLGFALLFVRCALPATDTPRHTIALCAPDPLSSPVRVCMRVRLSCE